MMLPGWPPRDWRALIALVASIAGGAVLTVLLGWIISILAGWGRARELGNIAYGLLLIIGLVLLALGFAINRRSFSGSVGPVRFSAEGGDDDDPPQQTKVVTETTVTPPMREPHQ
jgi:NhaP-type Na+/H+ or K+/H+ antiporter